MAIGEATWKPCLIYLLQYLGPFDRFQICSILLDEDEDEVSHLNRKKDTSLKKSFISIAMLNFTAFFKSYFILIILSFKKVTTYFFQILCSHFLRLLPHAWL